MVADRIAVSILLSIQQKSRTIFQVLIVLQTAFFFLFDQFAASILLLCCLQEIHENAV